MSTSKTNRAKISKQRSQISKVELDQEVLNVHGVKEVMRKTPQRSSSLNKQSKEREYPQKSQSVDRSMANRYSSQNISIKKSLIDPKKTNVENKKYTTSLRNQNASKSKDNKTSNSSSKLIKTSEKSIRSPVKGPSGKTNVEIAKSFVQNAKGKKIKHEIKNHSSKNSEKIKSKKNNEKNDEDAERPRTSTIRKGPLNNDNIAPERNKNEIENEKGLEYFEVEEQISGSKSAVEDDDKMSYEDDFEDYDSDFEDSETDSVSVSESPENVSDEEDVLDSAVDRNSTSRNFPLSKSASEDQKFNISEVKKSSEKTFLRMSDRSFLSDKTSPETTAENKIIKPSHSFINFATAVEQEKKKKYSNRVLKRASDLLEIVTLSDVTFNHLDIPPMKYDTYIRLFGKTDAKQVFVQTENFEDEEIQTDDIEVKNKWTQNPSTDNFGCGGDSSTDEGKEDADLKSLYSLQNVKLSSFLQNCSKVMLTILNEDYSTSSQIQATQRRNELFYSDGYYTLQPLDFLRDVPVLNICSNSEFSNYILTIHDGLTKVPHTDDEVGLICVWNFLDREKPEHILIAHSQPTCATFGPCSNSIVIAGMVDGSVVVWDLSCYSQGIIKETLSMRTSTYSTAVILGKENHHSCIVAIQALVNYSKSESETMNFAKQDNSKNFHVLTLEDMGIINIWVVVEVLKPDFSGLETDLGLSPGGNLRLVRSSSIFLNNTSALQDIQKINIRTFDFRLVPNDSSRILVTTDNGTVLHVNRLGGSANPRFFSNDSEFSSEVRCIDCSPHNEDLFLVGCSDGSAKLYNLKLVHPVMVFLLAAKGDPLTLIKWSSIHPAMFIVLSSTSSLYLWNLLEDTHHPINNYHFPDFRVTWFNFSNGDNLPSSHESPQKVLHMFISRDDGITEVHIFRHIVSDIEYSRQLEYMKNL